MSVLKNLLHTIVRRGGVSMEILSAQPNIDRSIWCKLFSSISTKAIFLIPWASVTTMNMLKRIIRIAIVVELILLIGFLPTLFNPNARIYGGSGGGWDWSPWGFVGPLAGLMFVIGLAIDYAVRKIKNPVYRAIVIAALVFLLAFIWMSIV